MFVRRDGPKGLLQQPYEEPYAIIKKMDKVFVVRMHGKDNAISIDRIKPAYIISDADEEKDAMVLQPIEDNNKTRNDDARQRINRRNRERRRGPAGEFRLTSDGRLTPENYIYLFIIILLFIIIVFIRLTRSHIF